MVGGRATGWIRCFRQLTIFLASHGLYSGHREGPAAVRNRRRTITRGSESAADSSPEVPSSLQGSGNVSPVLVGVRTRTGRDRVREVQHDGTQNRRITTVTAMITVLLVNAHADETQMYRACLAVCAGSVSVGVCDPADAVDCAVATQPDVIVTDLVLQGPTEDAVDLIRCLRRDFRNPPHRHRRHYRLVAACRLRTGHGCRLRPLP